MIIDSNNKKQKSILTNKCFYQTTARIMRDFEEKGYANSADETAKVIAAYHDIVRKKSKKRLSLIIPRMSGLCVFAITRLQNELLCSSDRYYL